MINWFQVDAELVKILVRLKAVHLARVIGIGQVEVGEGDKGRSTIPACGHVENT